MSCTVCMEPLRENVVSLARCGHCFHRDCIQRWLQTSATCPFCRVPTTKANFQTIYLNFDLPRDSTSEEFVFYAKDLCEVHNEANEIKKCIRSEGRNVDEAKKKIEQFQQRIEALRQANLVLLNIYEARLMNFRSDEHLLKMYLAMAKKFKMACNEKDKERKTEAEKDKIGTRTVSVRSNVKN